MSESKNPSLPQHQKAPDFSRGMNRVFGLSLRGFASKTEEKPQALARGGLLRFKKVSKNFGEIRAVSDISFEIEKGEFVFLTGPSAAGKTTLLRLVLRELKPDSGEIIFDGKEIGKLSGKEIPKLRQKIGVVFQDYKVLMERTVRENIEVALAVIGEAVNKWRTKVDAVLKSVGLEARAELFPAQLSGGEIQRVSLARALVVNPILILADEPTGNLDWDTSSAIMDLFSQINGQGKTILMATHNKMIVEKLGKREIRLEEGKIVK